MSTKTPIYDFLIEHSKKSAVSFHMPGHKHGAAFKQWGQYSALQQIAQLDITEIHGADNLHGSEGIIQEAQHLASKLYCSKETFFLINGTTSGIYAMILGTTSPRDKIIIPRNCHRSIINALVLGELTPIYTYPEIDENLAIATVVSPETIEKAVKENPDAKAVVITYPNYYGMACDIQRIGDIVHRAGMLLLVDGAHGSHFRFHPRLPLCALEAGADAVAHSTHKTTLSFTQSSMLHINSDAIDIQRIKLFLQLTQSTSPSYPLMASLDVSRAIMEQEGNKLMDRIIELSEQFRNKVNKLQGMYCLDQCSIGQGIKALDPTRLVINLAKTNLSGQQAEDILREKFNINVEFSDLYNIVCIASPFNDDSSFDILYKGLEYISKNHYNKWKKKKVQFQWAKNSIVYSPRDAIYKEQQNIGIEEAEGQVCGEYIIPYPPGIPLIVPGERISREALDILKEYIQSGISIVGIRDREVKSLSIIRG